jgi:hypothetical protein
MNSDSVGHTIPPDDEEDDDDEESEANEDATQGASGSKVKKWLLRMNSKLDEIPVGELDPKTMPMR